MLHQNSMTLFDSHGTHPRMPSVGSRRGSAATAKPRPNRTPRPCAALNTWRCSSACSGRQPCHGCHLLLAPCLWRAMTQQQLCTQAPRARHGTLGAPHAAPPDPFQISFKPISLHTSPNACIPSMLQCSASQSWRP
eukprot:1161423-Pelagomonas_calceolata.AAC.7